LAKTNVFPGMERAVVDLSCRQIMLERALEAISPYRARKVENVLEQLQPDVVFFPQQSIFPKNVAAPCALVVHDLYHLFLPQYLSRKQRIFRARNYAYSIARADQIIAISEFTKNTILEHYQVLSARITVVPHGSESGVAAPRESNYGFDKPYIYYPAITRPHKNHQALFDSIAALRAQGRFDYQLVLSGIQTPYWKTLCKQIRRLDLEDVVQHVGYVPYSHVQQLYRDAECIVFPSTFEGFGLPVTEAVEAGKKILVSQLDVFEEIGVPERFRINFADAEQFYRALQEPGPMVLENRSWTWDESASATMALLNKAAGCEPVFDRRLRAA
jgi:glycosyltransferase involved in cell wall biosynthesis